MTRMRGGIKEPRTAFTGHDGATYFFYEDEFVKYGGGSRTTLRTLTAQRGHAPRRRPKSCPACHHRPSVRNLESPTHRRSYACGV
jgi:TPP-dependent indolepyruvate ferredoxin oxidoreductase alpha subunit